jgi:hypothetical protein
MNRLTQFITLLLTAAIFLGGCSKDEPTAPNNTQKAHIQIGRDSIAFDAARTNQRILITNSGEGVLEWSISEKPDWVLVSKTSGQIETGSDTLFVWVNLNDVQYGDYSGFIKFNSNGGTFTLSVSLANEAPVLRITNTNLNFDRHYSVETVTIENAGGSQLIWKITAMPQWLWSSKSEDTLRTPSDNIFFSVDLASAPYGDFNEVVTIESNGGNAEILVYLSYHRVVEVFPGQGAAGMDIGGTFGHLKALYGNPIDNIEEISEDVIRHNLMYPERGLTFVIITEGHSVILSEDIIQTITVEAPYDGITDKNIGIGSSIADVETAYGAPDENNAGERFYKYNIGIIFTYNSSSGLVNKMTIF